MSANPSLLTDLATSSLTRPTVFGRTWFVNTTASSNGDGLSPASAFTTMAQALTGGGLGDNDTIQFRGTVREQLVAPLGVQGVKIIGCYGGNVRDDDGAKWTYPTTGAVAGKALIEIREQGWEFHNFLMTPETTTGACIKAHRNEDATYPDSSHFKCIGMRFVGTSGTPTFTPSGDGVASGSTTGTDSGGFVSVSSVAGIAGTFVTVTYSKGYPSNSYPTVSPIDGNSVTRGLFVSSHSANGFTVDCNSAIPAGGSASFIYNVTGT